VTATTVYAAPVRTMDPQSPWAEAFAVAGDRIAAVGTLADVQAIAPDAPVATLEGVVLPGLIDAHLHMQRGGLKALTYADPSADADEFIDVMARTFHDPDWRGEAPPTLDDRVAGLARIQPLLHALGFTGIVDPATRIEEMRGYQEAHRRGALTMRTVAMPYLEIGAPETPDVDAVIAHLEGTGVSTGFGDDTLRIGPIKVYADGEASRGQALLHEPWDESGYLGERRIPEDDFARLVAFCAAHGWGVGTHAVGGAAIEMVARAYARAGAAVRDRRFQVIHGYLEPSHESMRIAADAGAIASVQPSIIWYNGARLRERLGARAERANPLRSWTDAGATLALGSDGPYFAFDPRLLMWQCVTRRVDGSDDPLDAAEAITALEALEAYTTGAAYASAAEEDRGVIRPGAYADWALWSGDPATVPIDDLRGLRVRRTDVGGVTVFAEAGA
jgi:hypothetical protein